MYHYVRPIAASKYPGIKGLELAGFEGQLDYIRHHHTPVTVQQVLNAANGGEKLPPNALLLTFDDGYADHYTHVFPRLKARKMSGAFFPPARAVLEGKILDVNKIHFLLATTTDTTALVQHIETAIESARSEYTLQPLEQYRETYRRENRFDTAEVIYIKRMLQVALPEPLRAKITDDLFARHVSADEKDFARELYCSPAQLTEMAASEMSIGGHGYAHNWLNSLTPEQQATDIDLSMQMLESIGALKSHFLFCYPYGAYTPETVSLLKDRNCHAAFTTQVGPATITPNMSPNDLLQLPRLDTNDLPKSAQGAKAS